MVEIRKEDVKKMLVWDDGEPKVVMYVLAKIENNYICSSCPTYIDKVWVPYQNAEPLKGETNGT